MQQQKLLRSLTAAAYKSMLELLKWKEEEEMVIKPLDCSSEEEENSAVATLREILLVQSFMQSPPSLPPHSVSQSPFQRSRVRRRLSVHSQLSYGDGISGTS